jgi:DEAD/DEAH box helicase domain-containing protein
MEGDQAACRSILFRALVKTGRPRDQLARYETLSKAGRVFLEPAVLAEHVGSGALDLYLACEKIAPSDWRKSDRDIRLLLRAVLPNPGEVPAAKTAYTEAWRGLWRLVNLFQGALGFHVELDGLDTLLPPDMMERSAAPGPDAAAWQEARALCDEAFHPLIDALVAADVPGPDRFGDDLLVGGRVVGMMEFGWSKRLVAVAEEAHEGVGWNLIPFDPQASEGLIGQAVTRIVAALQETGS